jgi:Tfp pilus assembly protein PilF
MRNHRIWLGLLIAVPLIVFLAVQPGRASSREWVKVRSPHFTVITDAGETRGREVASHFENMREVFGAFMDAPNLSLPSPLQIVAFRNTKEMRRFVPLWRGKPVDMMGYFHQSGDCGVILLDLSVKNYAQTAFHEYAHQLLNANSSVQTQPWFDEGFAEFFSTMRWEGSQARVGGIHERDFKAVRRKGMMTTAELLQVRQDSADYNRNGDRRNIFYGQSWLTVHYLFDTHSLGRAFQYFSLLSQGTVDTDDAFQQSFGMSTARFDELLKEYARQKTLDTTLVTASRSAAPSSYPVRVLTETDADAELADVHLHSPDYSDQAVREFDAVLKRDPEQPVALRGLGYAYLQDRDFARAAEFLRRAENRDPQDARTHYYNALLIKEEGASDGRPSADNIETMQREVEKVIVAEPDYAAAYGLLALTYEWQGNQEKSLEAMKRAAKLNPRNGGYRADLVRMGYGDGTASLILKQLDARVPSSTQARFGQSKGGPSAPAK